MKEKFKQKTYFQTVLFESGKRVCPHCFSVCVRLLFPYRRSLSALAARLGLLVSLLFLSDSKNGADTVEQREIRDQQVGLYSSFAQI